MTDQKRATSETPSGKTGAGAEAAEGIHAQQQGGDREPSEKSSLEGREAASTNRSDPNVAAQQGSEPLARTEEHVGSYGGKGGAPRTSSDTREAPTKDSGTA